MGAAASPTSRAAIRMRMNAVPAAAAVPMRTAAAVLTATTIATRRAAAGPTMKMTMRTTAGNRHGRAAGPTMIMKTTTRMTMTGTRAAALVVPVQIGFGRGPAGKVGQDRVGRVGIRQERRRGPSGVDGSGGNFAVDLEGRNDLADTERSDVDAPA